MNKNIISDVIKSRMKSKALEKNSNWQTLLPEPYLRDEKYFPIAQSNVIFKILHDFKIERGITRGGSIRGGSVGGGSIGTFPIGFLDLARD